MKHRAFFNVLLLTVMLVNLSGAAMLAHQQVYHDATCLGTGSVESSHDHDHSHDEPLPAPWPSDHGDCSTCFVLTHVAAMTTDLASPPALIRPVRIIRSVPSRVVVMQAQIHLPDDRGPPHAHL